MRDCTFSCQLSVSEILSARQGSSVFCTDIVSSRTFFLSQIDRTKEQLMNGHPLALRRASSPFYLSWGLGFYLYGVILVKYSLQFGLLILALINFEEIFSEKQFLYTVLWVGQLPGLWGVSCIFQICKYSNYVRYIGLGFRKTFSDVPIS